MSFVIWIVLAITAILVLARIYVKVTMAFCKIDTRLDGRVVLVTGGSGGIGYETAMDLAKRGAEGEACRDAIKQISGNKNVSLRRLDVSSLKEVHQFARDFSKDFPRLHCLINNAGMMSEHSFLDQGKRELTNEGLEVAMATNYLGPFLLTKLLLPCLKKAASENPTLPCRIINVSSIAHFYAPLNCDDLDLNGLKRFLGAPLQYAASKLAQVLHARELHRQLQVEGIRIQCASLHPGFVRTDIFRDVGSDVYAKFIGLWFQWLGKDAREGAQTSIYLAVTEEDVGGKYYSDCEVAPWYKSRLRTLHEQKTLFQHTDELVQQVLEKGSPNSST